MTRIDDLIAQLAPDGVSVKALGDIAELVRGNGMPKAAFTEEGVGAIHYGQIYTRYGPWTEDTISFVAPETAARLARVDPGDVIITNTSENVEDVGKAVAWLGDMPIVTGGHATVIKHHEDSRYLSYWFQSPSFFAQKKVLATGTKVIDVSAKQLAKVRVPVPPLEVQREIARVLAAFTGLEGELLAEFEARRRQYAHYRDSLLAFTASEDVQWMPLSKLGSLYAGLTGKVKADFSNGNARFVSYMNVFRNQATNTVPNDFVAVADGERQSRVRYGDILFTSSSETADEVGMSSAVTGEPLEPLYLNSFCFGFRPKNMSELNPHFAKHLFRSTGVRQQIIGTADGVTRINVSKARFLKVIVPVPSPGEQKRIAELLDDFAALIGSLSAERTARRQQYEHYRDRLLTFSEAA